MCLHENRHVCVCVCVCWFRCVFASSSVFVEFWCICASFVCAFVCFECVFVSLCVCVF